LIGVLLDVPTAHGEARIELRRPRSCTGLVVLTHGAGGTPNTRDVEAAAEAAFALDAAVARVTQPYRVAGRRTPPAPGPQDAAWCDVIDALRARRGLGRVPLILGGRSNGARVACRTAPGCAAAAVLALAFPLHPPGRPDKTRIAELDAAHVPVLVLQGERDPFGRPPAGAQRRVVVLPGDGHGLTRNTDVIADETTKFVGELIGS
jgi:predicted alpha/beta-hydrolase family hydrolase